MKNFKIFFAVILVVSLAFATLGCGSSTQTKDKKFEGKISEQAYQTVEEATRAFFDEQINNGFEDCEYKSYTTKKELDKGDIGELALGEYEELIISAEKGKVGFTFADEVFNNDIYILQTEDGYHYYTTAPEEGEAVSYDYYDFLINEEIMSNVTIETDVMIVHEKDGFSRQTEVSFELLIDRNNIKFDVVTKKFYNGGISETSLSGYIVKDEDGNYWAYGLNEKGEYVDILAELNAFFSLEPSISLANVLSNYYIGGHYSFKLEEDLIVLRNREISVLAESFIDVYYGEAGGIVDSIAYDIKVAEDKITNVSANAHSTDSEVTSELFVQMEKKLSRYGETVVEIPEEVLALYEAK